MNEDAKLINPDEVPSVTAAGWGTLRRFTPYGIRQGHHETDRLFVGPGLCLRSYAAAVTGTSVGIVDVRNVVVVDLSLECGAF